MLTAKLSEGPRWPRGQKFALSAAGVAASDAYRAAVADARGGGRPALEAALAAWATPLAVAASDGVLLGELREKPRGFAEVARALEETGAEQRDLRLGLDRLVKAGLVELVPPPSAQEKEKEPPRPPPFRW